jgi:hypothetical protein
MLKMQHAHRRTICSTRSARLAADSDLPKIKFQLESSVGIPSFRPPNQNAAKFSGRLPLKLKALQYRPPMAEVLFLAEVRHLTAPAVVWVGQMVGQS